MNIETNLSKTRNFVTRTQSNNCVLSFSYFNHHYLLAYLPLGIYVTLNLYIIVAVSFSFFLKMNLINDGEILLMTSLASVMLLIICLVPRYSWKKFGLYKNGRFDEDRYKSYFTNNVMDYLLGIGSITNSKIQSQKQEIYELKMQVKTIMRKRVKAVFDLINGIDLLSAIPCNYLMEYPLLQRLVKFFAITSAKNYLLKRIDTLPNHTITICNQLLAELEKIKSTRKK